LTDEAPALLPAPDGFNGMTLQHSRPANDLLLSDLRSDRGMEWVPDKAWLTKIALDGTAPQFGYDLAVDATGAAAPSRVDAGLDMPGASDPTVMASMRWFAAVSLMLVSVGAVFVLIARLMMGRDYRAA
jgi:hypothetical protein